MEDDTINHDLCDLQDELDVLDLGDGDPHHLNMTSLVHAFKRKSFMIMPGKHQNINNAHTRFEQLNAAFLKVCQICHNWTHYEIVNHSKKQFDFYQFLASILKSSPHYKIYVLILQFFGYDTLSYL